MEKKESAWALTYDDYNPVAEFASILELSLAIDSKVVSSPIEQGSFTSYNKVDLPDSVGFRAILAGTAQQQEDTLVKLKELKKSTQLLRLLTPFESFSNLNLITVKWERTVDVGSSRTVVDLTLQEIRQEEVITGRMSKPAQCKNASSVSNVKTGKTSIELVNQGTLESVSRKYPWEEKAEKAKEAKK